MCGLKTDMDGSMRQTAKISIDAAAEHKRVQPPNRRLCLIGMHVEKLLLAFGDSVLGIDSLNDSYDPALKRARLAQLSSQPGFRLAPAHVENHATLNELLATEASPTWCTW